MYPVVCPSVQAAVKDLRAKSGRLSRRSPRKLFELGQKTEQHFRHLFTGETAPPTSSTAYLVTSARYSPVCLLNSLVHMFAW